MVATVTTAIVRVHLLIFKLSKPTTLIGAIMQRWCFGLNYVCECQMVIISS